MKDNGKAWLISCCIHLAIFGLLGASGLFSYLHEKNEPSSVTDVTVYDENALLTRGPAASGGGDSGAEGDTAIVMKKEVVEHMPPISQSYTKEHVKKEGKATSEGTDKVKNDTSHGKGGPEGTGHGQRHGDGHGSGPSGNGHDERGARSLRPAKKAHLLSQGNFTVPPSARNSFGTISLSIVIGPDGSVVGASVTSNSSGNDDVAQAALEFAYTLRYAPGENEYGQAITQSKTITLSY